MFILDAIIALPDDLASTPDSLQHKLTFKLEFTIKDVPDSFTGIVMEDGTGQLVLQHFNQPKGNKRKIITLKNKLVAGGFEKIKRALFAESRAEPLCLPLEVDTLKKRISGTPRAWNALFCPQLACTSWFSHTNKG